MNIAELGIKLGQRRKAMGIRQKDLCLQLGISRVTLSSFENGRRCSISLHRLGALLDRLDLELDLREKGPLPTLDDLLAARSDTSGFGSNPAK